MAMNSILFGKPEVKTPGSVLTSLRAKDPVLGSHRACQGPDRPALRQLFRVGRLSRERVAPVLLARHSIGRGDVYLGERQVAEWHRPAIHHDPESRPDENDQTLRARPIILQVRCQLQWRGRQGNNFWKFSLVSCSLFQ